MQLRQRLAGRVIATSAAKAGTTPPAPAPRGLASTGRASSTAAAASTELPYTPAVAADAGAITSDDEDSVEPPPPPRKRKLPPVDIGIPALLLGGGGSAAADAVDALPLCEAGFTPQSLQAACDFLAKADPKLVPLIEQHCPPERLLAKRGSNFATLAKAIVFQQLATRAAATIYGRVLTSCSCTDSLTPAAVLAAPLKSLRDAGLSERKASYIVDLAQHFEDGTLSDEKISAMDEAELEADLTKVRGIGVWTVHMHAMFHLGSPDVLPTGDLGVRRGMQQLYNLKELPSPAAMAKVAEKWRPFRSVGSYLMWKVDVPKKSSSGGGGGKAKKKARKG